MLENVGSSKLTIDTVFDQIVEMKSLYNVQLQKKSRVRDDFSEIRFIQIEIKRMLFYSYARWMEFAKRLFSLFSDPIVLLIFCERNDCFLFNIVYEYFSKLEKGMNGKPAVKPVSDELWYVLEKEDKLEFDKELESTDSLKELYQNWKNTMNPGLIKSIQQTEKAIYPLDDFNNLKKPWPSGPSMNEYWEERRRNKWRYEKNVETKTVFPDLDSGSYNVDDDYY